ncbi:Hypothetical predicted protein [Paramuricea clavata]|uniref:Uncharacterized protein n=1 Tax=Paramuricea clavata TaxID=317549 RepID=A0A7D9M602_PARCT|nr:Hypothetical predicted protein [Paramuricea clavata]
MIASFNTNLSDTGSHFRAFNVGVMCSNFFLLSTIPKIPHMSENDNPSAGMRGRYPRQSYKTEITDPSSGDQMNTPSLNLCIIHQKPHRLSKCRAFRAKPIDERKTLFDNTTCVFVVLPQPATWQRKIVSFQLNALNTKATNS